jgi:hypothetical protein
MQNRYRFLVWPALLLALLASACGTKNVGVNGPSLSAPQQNERASAGVTVGDFEVVRYNQQGHEDSALNPTLQLSLQNGAGETALVINVKDGAYTDAVNTEVHYDAERYHPVRAEFAGLLGKPDQVLTASFLDNVPGVAGIGAVAMGDYKPGALNGKFATVFFAPGPDRAVSAAAGDSNDNPLGVADVVSDVTPPLNNLTVDTSVTDTVTLTWTAVWEIGDCDGNSEVNVADLTPMGKVFKASTATTFKAVPSDTDRNGQVTVSDLTPIGKHFKQSVSGYLVEASDDDGTGKVTVGTVQTSDKHDPDTTADPSSLANPLTAISPYWTLTFDSNSSFSFSQLKALDVNADSSHLVQITITPQGQSGKAGGVPASIAVPVSGSVTGPTPNQLIITGFSVEVNDGAATPNPLATLDDTNLSYSTVANSSIGFRLKSIKGQFNGKAFDGGPAPPADPNNIQPTDMTQADYDTAYTAAISNTIWNVTSGGDAAARRTSDWVTFSSGSSPYLGGLPSGGTVFPDYDPESSATDSPPDPEGTLTVTLPTNGGALPGGGTAQYPDLSTPDPGLQVKIVGQPVVNTFHVDVTKEPSQPILTPYTDQNGNAMTELILNRRNTVYMNEFAWGDVTQQGNPPADTPWPAPADYNTVTMEMCRIGSDGSSTGTNATFSYVQTIDPASLNPGQFTIINGLPDPQTGFPTYYAIAIVNGSTLVQGANYAFRMNVAGDYSSVNVPTDTLTTAPPPPPQALELTPTTCADADDQIQIRYKNSNIRRNGDMQIAFVPPTGPQFQATNQAAFDDELRNSPQPKGYEFAPSIDYSHTPPNQLTDYYPRVVVKADASGPISGLDDPDQEPACPVLLRGAGRVVVDVSSLTSGQGLQDPGTKYNVELFDQGGVELGTGSFTYDNNNSFAPSLADLNWGVNVFDREDLDLSARNYDENINPDVHTVDGSNLKNPVFPVPVVFFEWYGGSMSAWQQQEEFVSNQPPTGNDLAYGLNAYVQVQDEDTGRSMYWEIGLRLSGVDPDGTFIGIHTVTLDDYQNPGFPGGSDGVFDTGGTYDMTLFDPAHPGSQLGFTDKLHVQGNNPNV